MESTAASGRASRNEAVKVPAPIEPRVQTVPAPIEPRLQPARTTTAPAAPAFVPATMAGDDSSVGLAALVADATKLREAVVKTMKEAVPPGQIAADEATRLMSLIANKFPGVDRADVELALMVWGILNGTGGEDDYSQKPAIKAGGISVAATDIFGPIVPTGVSGIARQFMSTMFEKHVAAVLKADPTLVEKLAPRIARAGLAPGQAICVVDFVRGVTSSTQGGSADRQRAKEILVARKANGGRFAGGPRVAPPAVVADFGDAGGSHVAGGDKFWS